MERDCKGVAFERQRCHPWKRPLGAPCPWSCNVGLGTIPRMSSAVVEIRTHCPAEVETRILEAVHASIVDSFKVLPVYRTSRRRCASPAALRGTPVAQRPNARPMAASTCRRTGPCRPSASGTGSRERYRLLSAHLQALGTPGACVLIRLHELPPEKAGVRGGQPECDVEFVTPSACGATSPASQRHRNRDLWGSCRRASPFPPRWHPERGARRAGVGR